MEGGQGFLPCEIIQGPPKVLLLFVLVPPGQGKELRVQQDLWQGELCFAVSGSVLWGWLNVSPGLQVPGSVEN